MKYLVARKGKINLINLLRGHSEILKNFAIAIIYKKSQ